MRLKDVEQVRARLHGNPQRRIPEEIYDEVARTGALLRGHFALQGGDHSEYFLRFSHLGWERSAIQLIAKVLLEQLPFEVSGRVILCSESAGLFLGHELARQAGVPLAVTKVDLHKRPVPAWREGALKAGDKVIVVSDVITRGGALEKLLSHARSVGAEVEGVATFATLQPAELASKLRSNHLSGTWLLEAGWKLYPQGSDCPQCTRGEPLIRAVELA